MRRALNWLPAFGTSLLLATNALAAPSVSPDTPGTPPAAVSDAAEDRELRPLLEKLSELSRLIDQNAQSPQAWQYHLEQAEVLLRLAVHSQDKERDNILRMAVDGYASAALLAPQDKPGVYNQLRQLPQWIAQTFSGSPVIHYAVLKEIEADCLRVLEKSGGDNVKAQEHRCTRLLQFAQQHPEMPEAAKAVLEAAQISESLGETDEACRCYRYLVEHFSADAAARKAGGALWRLGQSHEPVQVELPLLYSSGNPANAPFNINQLHGSLVVLYFWSSAKPKADEDFQVLKQITDRYVGHGVEVVYVNMDEDAKQGRAFLSGRLTAGVHLYQKGGLQGAIAERYGIQEVPQAFLIGKDGTLLRHSLPATRIETEMVGYLSRGR
ncbi:MAG TPA: thioredoxin family protein [Gemmataceae bacterium]|nr:thioredoxin family protein [Gemmataceae bacterium]